MSDLTRLEQILLRDGKIENFSAIHSRLTLRLGARIWDLEQRGWQSSTEERSDKNTVYHVVAGPKPQQLEFV
jgi:hypothetical protein